MDYLAGCRGRLRAVRQRAFQRGRGEVVLQLTFTNAVPSVQLDAGSNGWDHDTHVTLTGHDASNAVVGTDSVTQPAYAPSVHLSVASASNNIKYFTIATDDPYQMGLLLDNIVWGCAAEADARS